MDFLALNNNTYYKELNKKIRSAHSKELSFTLLNILADSFIIYLFLVIIITLLHIISPFGAVVKTGVTQGITFSYSALIIFCIIYYIRSKSLYNAIKYSFFLGNKLPSIKDKISNALSLFSSAPQGTSIALINANIQKVSEETKGVNLSQHLNFKKLTIKISAGVIVFILFSLTLLFSTRFASAFNELWNFKYKNNLSGFQQKEDTFIKSFSVKLIYPAFTKLDPKLQESGEITCIEGTKAEFQIEFTEEISSAKIDYNNAVSDLKISGTSASGTIEIDKDGYYKFILVNTQGKENFNRLTYNIKVLPNQPPHASITQPQNEVYNISSEKDLILKFIIADDFGLDAVSLKYRYENGKQTASNMFNTVQIPLINKDATSLEIQYQWILTGISRSGKIEYYVEVTDNSGKTGTSEHKFLSFTSNNNFYQKSILNTTEVKQDLNQAMQDLKDLQKNVNELRKNQEGLAVNEQRKKELQEKLNSLQQNVENVQKKIDQTIQDMQQNPELNPKTLEQYMKLQEMFNKLYTPEFKKMLEKLQEAMKKDNRQMMQDLDKINFDEEQFKKQIEKVMELLKKIENLQKFGEVTKNLDDLTKEQQRLKKETENTPQENQNKFDNLSNNQKDLQEKFDKLKEDMKKLIENMKNTKEEISPKDLENLLKKMNEKQTSQKMDKSFKELMKQQKQNSEETQDDINEDMQQFNEDMQNALEKAMDNMETKQKMSEKMKNSKKQLEELTEKQKQLKKKTEKTDNGDKQEMKDQAKEQNSLQSELSKVINDLMNMTKQGMESSPELGKELGNAYNKMGNSKENLENSERNNSIGNQGKAIESLENATKMLGDMIKRQGQKSGKGNEGRMGELMQRLAGLISMQQGVNSKMNQMGQKGKLGKDGKDGQEEMPLPQKEQLDKLRIEQMDIQKSLEELNAEFEKEKQRSGDKPLGDMNEVTKDMQESIRQMSKYELDQQLIERQNKIISRMLDAQLSQREKDFEQKRESKPGDNVIRLSPKEIIINGARTEESIKQDLLRLERSGYTPDFEKIIMEYYKMLGK